MRYRSQRGQPAPEPLWRRLDRVAGEINPFLMVLAIGLFVLYLTGIFGLLIKLPITHIDPAPCTLPPQVTGNVGAGGM
jgi:hypothetical protein